ncbi:mitochondrial carrier domain-containing protein [Kalaharituber pfeilii]|nr:mitochondrial carrier domain-containing protein [Kalaharituber pfeilii]
MSPQHTPADPTRNIVLAGGVAAFTVDLLTYPIDTVKTRLQSIDYKRYYAHRAAMWRGLYQGVGTVIISTIPSSAAFFTTYEFSKSFFGTLAFFPQPVIHSLSSSMGELVSCAILTPAEVLKQQAQTLRGPQLSTGKGLLAGITNSTSFQTFRPFRNHPRYLFRGYFALVGRNLPFTALQFPLYERLRMRLGGGENIANDVAKTIQVNSMAAGLAAASAAVITTPIDVVKTRIMLGANKSDNGGAMLNEAQQRYENLRAKSRGRYQRVVREIFHEDGMKGFSKGVTLRGAWSGLAFGIYLGTYEGGKAWLRENPKIDAMV